MDEKKKTGKAKSEVRKMKEEKKSPPPITDQVKDPKPPIIHSEGKRA